MDNNKDKCNYEELLSINENVKIVQTLSKEDLLSLLEDKAGRYNFIDKYDTMHSTAENFLLENIINSFCSPENISEVADNFIKRNTFK